MALRRGGDEEERKIPVVVHAMSNGGCFLLEEMERLLLEKDESKRADELSAMDAALIADRMALGYQLFDSCPCYIRTFWWEHTFSSSNKESPLRWNESFPHPHWTRTRRWLYTAGATTALSVWCTLTGAFSRARDFWTHMANSRLCLHQVYLYTTTDTASDAAAVDRLIQHRQQHIPELQTTVHRWEDSGHCRLHRDHAEQYQAIIEGALTAAVERAAAVEE